LIKVFALLPILLLQFSYGMNTGFPAILTPQLMEAGSEFFINEDEESWIVSLDNLATPIICILSGCLQQVIGPKKVHLRKGQFRFRLITFSFASDCAYRYCFSRASPTAPDG
jgi:hypothetical protein